MSARATYIRRFAYNIRESYGAIRSRTIMPVESFPNNKAHRGHTSKKSRVFIATFFIRWNGWKIFTLLCHKMFFFLLYSFNFEPVLHFDPVSIWKCEHSCSVKRWGVGGWNVASHPWDIQRRYNPSSFIYC